MLRALAFVLILAFQQLQPHGANPVLLNAVEESIIMEDGQCTDIFKTVQTHRVYYAYATDPYCQTWTLGNNGQPILPFGYVYPNAFKIGATYYLTTIYGGDYQLYLWSSTDRTTWALANNGQPILHHGTNNADWFYTLINTTVAVDSTGRWHLLIECKDNLGNNFHTGYSYSTLDEGPNFDTHLSTAPVFSGTTGNPWLIYVPERNSVLAIAGAIPNVTWVLRAWSASLSADLRQASSWIPAPGFSMQAAGIHLTDPSLVFSTDKPWATMLAYHYNQLDGWRAYGPWSAPEFYDLVVAPHGTQSNVLSLGPFGDAALSRLAPGVVAVGTGAWGAADGTVKAAVHIGRAQLPSGTCGAPAAFFELAPTTGWYLDAASVGACVGGVPALSAGITGAVARGFGIWGVTSAIAGGANLASYGAVQFGGQTMLSGQAPTVAAPAMLATGAKHTGFTLDVGPTPGATITINLPAGVAPHGWSCGFTNTSNPLDHTTKSAMTTTSVTLTSTAGWAAHDQIDGSCFPY